MARIASQQIAGYYPSPQSLVPSFASTLRLPELETYTTLNIFDPCAGDGAAVLGLRRAWDAPNRSIRRMEITACELEPSRATRLSGESTHEHPVHALAGDAFCLRWDAEARGADVLFLNPPYDHDPDFGRLELKFLDRFTDALVPGHGALMLLVPFYVLGHCADFLARHYLDHRAWRLPDKEFGAFKQALLVARRAPTELHRIEETRQRLEAWGADPTNLPVLPETSDNPLAVTLAEQSARTFTPVLVPVDLTQTLRERKPWDGVPLGLDDARSLLGARFHTATPPKPAHIALALSSGMFNGHRLEPNDPSKHPPILAKGTFERHLVKLAEKFDDEGEITGTVEVEQPRLRISILRLDTYEYRELRPGVVPTGLDDMDSWNAADLIVHYDGALARLMGTQFPPLHDPSDPRQLLAMPSSPRTPFKVQHHAISTALKLIATGENPFFVAEVGTGKSTMGLFIALALSPEHCDRTVSELRRCGFHGAVPTVKRTLILCPPHLLKSWKDQAGAVMPDARVKILRQPSDLEADADLYILSREAAKLGHRRRGLEGRCPKCGTDIETSAKDNASKRLRCEHMNRRPANLAARLAHELARAMARADVRSPLVVGLVEERYLLQRRTRPKSAYDAVQRLALDHIARAIKKTGQPSVQLLEVYSLAALHSNTVAKALEDLEALCTDLFETKPRDYGTYVLKAALENLRTGSLPELRSVLEGLVRNAEWTLATCGEPLYQSIPSPRRVPLARLIQQRYRDRFDLVLADEAHEYNNMKSAQTHALHRLVGLPGVTTVVLTGSLMGGYASSLFANFHALSPRFREEMGRDDLRLFVDRYGYRKVFVGLDGKPSKGEKVYGTVTDRDMTGRIKPLGEAPGILPSFLTKHLLPVSVFVHKDDLDDELPPITEEPMPVIGSDDPRDALLLMEYERLRDELLTAIRNDRFGPRQGKLLGALVELPSYLDRCTEDQGEYVIRYPLSCGGGEIARAMTFPEDYMTPKERWLLSELSTRLENDEKVIVFLRHTGTAKLPERLLRLIEDNVTDDCAWLDTKKVPAAKREAWINKEILAKDVKVLLVNADAVRTGLNNLVTFTTAIWHELTWSATTYRQANGRVHRIGQTKPVSVLVPYFAGTAQETGFDLVAQKVSASLQVDGLDMQAALEAAGASEESSASVATAMALGEAVYRAMTAEAGQVEELAA